MKSLFKKFSLCGVAALPRIYDDSEGDRFLDSTHIDSFTGSFTLYLHIPYCNSICSFCQLRLGGKAMAYIPDAYVDSIIKEIESISRATKSGNIDSIYFGGGTPSLLTAHQIDRILSSVYKCFSASGSLPVSIEGDAHTFLKEGYVEDLSGLGISKLSVGVQTFDEMARKLLSRKDTVKEIFALRELFEKSGMADFNIDYLYNLPTVSDDIVNKDLGVLGKLEPTSVDLHPLKYTSCSKKMLRDIKEKCIPIPDADTRLKELKCLREGLRSLGYNELFIGYYSFNGRSDYKYISRLHGLMGGDYLGVGLGARSYIGSYAFSNTQDLPLYLKANGNKEQIISRSSVTTHPLPIKK